QRWCQPGVPASGAHRHTLGQQLLANLAAIDDFNRPRTWSNQFLVGPNADLVVDRRGKVLGADGGVVRLARGRTARSHDRSPLHPSPSHDDAKDFGPMVATGILIDL